MANIMIQTGTITGVVLLLLLFGLALFSYSIYAGKRLLTDEAKDVSVILSLINFALQLFQWKLLGYGLSYSSGIDLVLGFEGLNFKASVSAIVATFNMSINSGNNFYIKVNLAAVLIVVVLADILKELKEKKELPEQKVHSEEASQPN
jgi:hypothetical protein